MSVRVGLRTTRSDYAMETNESERAIDSENEDIEGLDDAGGSWGDYPLDDLLIRSESRTIYDVTRHMTLRLHYWWSGKAGDPVFIVYAGPKITRQ